MDLTNDEWMESQEDRLRELASSGSPLLRVALQEDFDFDLDRLFEYGLARLLDGLEICGGPITHDPPELPKTTKTAKV